MTASRLLLTAALLVGLASPVAAHRGHSGLTVVEVNTAAGTVAVSHRFAIHDVEPALRSIAPAAQPSFDDPKAVTALEVHLAQRFRLSLDGQDVPLSRTETRLAGDHVRVNFAGATEDADVDAAIVDLDFFPGVHDDQEIQVNVRVDGVTRTVVFRPGAKAQTVSFTG